MGGGCQSVAITVARKHMKTHCLLQIPERLLVLPLLKQPVNTGTINQAQPTKTVTVNLAVEDHHSQ